MYTQGAERNVVELWSERSKNHGYYSIASSARMNECTNVLVGWVGFTTSCSKMKGMIHLSLNSVYFSYDIFDFFFFRHLRPGTEQQNKTKYDSRTEKRNKATEKKKTKTRRQIMRIKC